MEKLPELQEPQSNSLSNILGRVAQQHNRVFRTRLTPCASFPPFFITFRPAYRRYFLFMSHFDCRFHQYSAFLGTEDCFGSTMIFPLHFIPSHSKSHQTHTIIHPAPIEKCMHGGSICREYRQGFKLWQPSTEHENMYLY